MRQLDSVRAKAIAGAVREAEPVPVRRGGNQHDRQRLQSAVEVAIVEIAPAASDAGPELAPAVLEECPHVGEVELRARMGSHGKHYGSFLHMAVCSSLQ